MLGVNAEFMVSDVNCLPDPVLRDSILFALKAAREPHALTDADFESLLKHGISRAEIVELISVSALAVYLNIIADATAVEPDDMIKA
jgi:alkylhydroperoxidase family enzyme